MKALALSLVLSAAQAASTSTVVLNAGYITKVRCEGRILISAVGEPGLVALEALPANVGCGVLLKPLAKSGRTNLVLETTTGSVGLLVEIVSPNGRVDRSQLDVKVRAIE